MLVKQRELPCLLSQRISELEYENERLRATIRSIVGDCVDALDQQQPYGNGETQ